MGTDARLCGHHFAHGVLGSLGVGAGLEFRSIFSIMSVSMDAYGCSEVS